MICYHCGCNLTEHDFCTNCGADVSSYKVVVSASNVYYNEGLEKAKEDVERISKSAVAHMNSLVVKNEFLNELLVYLISREK